MKIQCPNCFEYYENDVELCPHCGYVKGEHAAEALHMDPGSVLQNRYRIGRVLGFGGFGVTYLAWDMVLDTKVAIKEYLPSEFSTRSPGITEITVFNGNKEQQFKDGLERFVAEAKRLAKFQHEQGIVSVFDSFMENNTAYIVMEYLEGMTLTSYLEQAGTLAPEIAIGLLTPVMKSLEAVHKEGIIHRDIAPDNIMVTVSGEVKLIDFGAARYATTSHSRSLTVIIKPGYSPEEQYRSRGDQGAHTDVYAMAAVLYRMITGVTPPDALERRAYFENGKKDILEPPSKYVKKLDMNVETAVLNAMNVRIEDRTATMKQFFEELTSEEPVKRRVGKIKKIDLLKWPLWAKIAAPVGIVCVATVLSLFFMGVIGFDANLQTDISIPDDMTRVPSVVNDSVENAEPRLEEAQLLYTIEKYQTDSLVPANMIFSQTYGAGSVVTVNSLMGLTISKGADMVEVPDVAGYEMEAAQEQLEDAGFTIEVVHEYSDIIAEGSVIAQSVKSGEEVEKGSLIVLTVSKGVDPDEEQTVELVKVPDFDGMTYEEALQEAEKTGIRIAVSEREYSDEYEENRIMAQSIQADQEVYNDNVVYLTVSKGKQIYKVPDVIGYQVEDAIKLLEEQGYAAEITEVESDIYAAGLVFVQNPVGNTELAAGGSVSLTVSKGSKAFSVKDVTGMSEEEAKNTLQAQGMTVTVTYEEDKNTPEGTVIRQTPASGSQAQRGDEAVIVVCTAAKTAEVADVSGKTKEDAESILKGQGFVVSIAESASETVEKGCVISQAPAAGTSQLKGAPIVIVISTGKETLTVTNVTGATESIAVSRLKDQGFATKISYEYSETVQTGIVISQSPASGSGAYRGDTISLVVSKGAAPVEIPDLRGKTQSAAEQQLEKMGFLVVVGTAYSDTVAAGQVISQSPSAGSTGYKNDKVQLTVSLGKAAVPVTALKLNQSSVGLTEGDTLQLTVAVSPSNATDKTVTYESSNTKVAAVSQNGLITAKAVGTATITAKSSSGGIRTTCTVTVEAAKVTQISVSSLPNKTTYYIGDSIDETGIRLKVIYNNGVVDYISSGYKTTYDFSSAGSKSVKLTYEGCETSYSVTVKEPSVILSVQEISLFCGDTYTLTASVLPTGVRVVWNSSDTSVVSVADGLLTANAKGTATITASITYQDRSYQASCSVIVNSTGIALDNASIQVYIGDTFMLNAMTNPADQPVTWSSSNIGIAAVSQGKVTAVAAGSVTITASIVYGGTTYKASCSVEVSLPQITLNKSTLSLYSGDNETLSAVTLPAGQSVSWSSSNTGVATVSGGKITAVAAGSATITASMTYGEVTYKATCSVTVTKPIITVSASNASLYIGDTTTLTTSTTPSGTSVSWSSSNTGVATVSGGKITAVGSGSATITASMTYGGTTYKATCSVTVTKPSVSLNRSSLSIYVGDTSTLIAAVVPSGTSVSWSSSNTGAATVSSSGKVTAVGSGSATITASMTYGGTTYRATCSVTVTKPSVSLNKSSVSLYVGDTSTLTVTVVPSGTSVSWSSSNTGVATVSGGKITAVGSGSATITASMTYGGTTYRATCSVTVTKPSVSLNKSSLSVYVGDTSSLTATVVPSGTSVTWSSSNTGVATVSGGKITAVGSGSATITASMTYRGTTYKATCNVTVTKPSVSLNKSSLSVYVGDTSSLTATVVPSGTRVNWSSSNTGVATVSGGKITAVGSGSATITASMTYRGTTYKATCNVTVTKPSVSLNKSSLSVYVGDTSSLTATVVPSGTSVTWSSSNTGVAAVSGGKVTAVGSGSAIITASITYGGTTCKATCSVTVTKPSVSLNKSSLSIYVGDTSILTAAVIPNGTSVSWSSSNTGVATVSSSGKVTGVAAGNTTITASITYGGTTYKATCSVRVSKVYVSTISRSSSSVNLTIKDTGVSFNSSGTSSSTTVRNGISWSISHSINLPTYTLTFTTNSATDPSLTVTSSDTSVVKVSSQIRSGNTTTVVITAVHNGNAYNTTRTATIVAKANDGSGVTTSVSVSVKEPWSYSFSSSNSSVLYISSDGNTAYGVQAGTATITVVSLSGYTASKTITVSENSSWAPHTYRVRSNINEVTGGYNSLAVRTSPSSSSTALRYLTYSSGNFYVSRTYWDGTRMWGYTTTYSGWVSLWYSGNEYSNAYIIN